MIKYTTLILLFAVALLAGCSSAVSEKSLQGSWKLDVSGLKSALEAEIEKQAEKATGMEKAGIEMAKAMIPKMIESFGEMRLELKDGGKVSMKTPSIMGSKAETKEGSWKLSEDGKSIILEDTGAPSPKINVVSNNKLSMKIEETGSPIKELVFVRAN
ncbi:MAG: hypothetical protein HC913_12390 [Microscillaceae bacterium]|nr:hypothetical protein [Microscillaceae bacterium]